MYNCNYDFRYLGTTLQKTEQVYWRHYKKLEMSLRNYLHKALHNNIV